MKFSYVFVFLFFGCIESHAQTIHFLKSYGNTGYDYGRDIKQTSDTGYICTGSSSSFGSGDADAFLMKVDSLGNLKWSYNYGGPGTDWGQKVAITYDSTYALGGFTNSFGNGGFDFYLVRAGINGFPLWEKTYGGSDWDKAYGMIEIPEDSGFVLVGETFSFGNGGRDVYIVRTNKNGDTLWTKTYGGPIDDYAKSVLLDGDSIVICGGTESYGSGMSDGLIIKMGLDGNIGWTKIVGMEYEDFFSSITAHSNYYVLGGTRSYNYLTEGYDQWIYKLYNNGTLIYDDIYSGCPADDEVGDLFVHPFTQEIYFASYTKSYGEGLADGLGDLIFSKYTSGFFYITAVTYGEFGEDKPYGIEFTNDGGFVAIGDLSLSSTGGNNIFILKYNYLFEHIDQFTELVNDDITLTIDDELSVEVKIIYPNPFHSSIYLPTDLEVTNTKIVDLYGNIVYETNLPESEINLEFLQSGVYLIYLSVDNNSLVQRLIKM